jgi:hypothetical protein
MTRAAPQPAILQKIAVQNIPYDTPVRIVPPDYA